jgi:glutamate synthase (NADPH/NADH) small chain
MPKQDQLVRIKNFDEVALGYTPEQAMEEASRCLQCKNALCVKGCPVEIDIPAFIKYIREGNFLDAVKKIKEKNSLPAICGRVCPQENQCEKFCVMGRRWEPIAIGRLERFVADYERSNNKVAVKSSGEKGKVACVGSGPASLTCAADLAMMGYGVTLFESLHVAGGVLMYGIPEFRLPKKVVQEEADYVKSLGVELVTDVIVGKTVTIDELFKEGYQAIFIGTGAGLPKFLGIPGENLNGVYSANEFLIRVNLMKAYLFPKYHTPIYRGSKVAVVGGGNVAMDAARVALRLGAEVYVVYRRGEAEMPARKEEVENAKEEGVKFVFYANPIRVLGEEWVTGLECLRMELGEPDGTGRRRPIPIPNSNFVLECDSVVIAIGQSPNPLIPLTTEGLKIGEHGNIVADSEGRTTKKGVFAGGDITSGEATVIAAMAAGKRAARAIDQYIQKGVGW